jgi:hypothetical protein
MKKTTLFLSSCGIIALLLFLISCSESPTENDTTPKQSIVTGRVLDSLNSPIVGAIVVDRGTLAATDTTDANGYYSLVFNITEQYTTTLHVVATGYYSDSAGVSVSAGGTVTRNFNLKRNYSEGLITGSLKPAANIILVSASQKTISIRGTGLTDYSVLKFQITDSLGNPIVGTNKAWVKFSLLSGPGGGEYISPDSAETDNLGMVTATVWSGTRAGVVQVNVQAANGSVKAYPLTIAITGGYPDGEHFSISRTQINLAGMLYDGLTTTVSVVVGDRNGNPCVPSVVKFTTNGGNITGSAITNDMGIATATLVTGNPRPADGLIFVTATTVGDTAYRRSDSLISATTVLIFSGKTQIAVPTSPLIVPDSGTVSFKYRVSDVIGNPIVGGSTITVKVTNLLGQVMSSVQLLGDVNVTTKDLDTATYFNATIAKTVRSAQGGQAIVMIDVTTPAEGNGNASKGFSAYVQSTSAEGGSAGFGQTPYSIEVLSAPNTNLTVAEGGTDPNSFTRLDFVVKDSLGNRIINFANSGIPSTYVAFSIIPTGGLGGGEQLMPGIDSLSDAGTVSTIFRAGSRSGIVRVAASIVGSSRPPAYVDLVISGGYPDNNRVIATLDKQNYPGFVTTGQVGTISIQMSDQFNNPARAGTPIYFTTTGGLVQPSTTLDGNGRATAVLYGGGQVPSGGFGSVILTTFGMGEIVIQRQLPFVFSGSPIITIEGLTNDSINVYSGFESEFSYRVADGNGNPLAAGNRVSVTVSGTASRYITLSGDNEVTTIDTRDQNQTYFKVYIKADSITTLSNFIMTISVSGVNGSVTRQLQGTLYPVGTSIANPANIEFLSASMKNIAIHGTGLTDYTIMSFRVTDSSGRLVVGSDKAVIHFSLLNAPGGGEYISPENAVPNNFGIVTTTLRSGTKAGIVQVSAQTADGKVKANPATITISGGFPDADHFSISRTQINLAGMLYDNLTSTIMVVVGDRYGNPPVQSPVKFTTTAGNITGSALTDDNGIARATLITGNSRPADGRVIVTATTIGDTAYRKSDSVISATAILMFSGKTQITVPTTPLIVPDSGTVSFNYRVSDELGNPIVGGSTITVRVTDMLGKVLSSVQLLGDVNVTTLDTYDATYTNFTATIAKTSRSAAGGPAIVLIEVTSPQYGNGNASKGFSAFVQSTSAEGGSAGFGQTPYSIEVLGDPNKTLTVAEGSVVANSFTALDFVVKDSSGNRIINFANSGIPRTYVAFSLIPTGGLGGGEQLMPEIDSLSDAGNVSTIFRAGSRSGIVRVAASIVGSSRPPAYVDLVISGGYPDNNRVIATLDKQNYPGFVTTGAVGTISIQMSDQFNNPARVGTPIYLTSTGGQVQPQTALDNIGTATAVFYGGGQIPSDGGQIGAGHIVMNAYGRDSVLIQRSLPFLFSGKPVIQVSGITNDSIDLYSGDKAILNFKVADENGNPLAAGNSVTVSVTGSAAGYITLSGDKEFVTVDTRDVNYTNFQVVLNGGDISTTSPFDVLFNVTGPNGTTSKRLFGRLYYGGTIIPPSEESRQPAQIAWVSSSTSDIYVAGTGSTENAVITYEVRDSLGNAIEPSSGTIVKFDLSFLPSSYNSSGTDPELIPDSAEVDNNGRVRVMVYSGTRAGIVQVRTRLELPTKTIISEPVKVQVHAGFADQRHFTLGVAQKNFPGLDKAFVNNYLTAQVVDKYSNPVAVGTSVRFETWHGSIGTGTSGSSSGITNIDGFVSQTMWSSNPFPIDSDSLSIGAGYSYVKAFTEGQSGSVVQDSIILLWTGEPIIVKTAGPDTFVIPDDGNAGETWRFTVTDKLGHPLSAGTTISISSPHATPTTDANVTLGDTFRTGDGITSFYVQLEDDYPNDTKSAPDQCVLQVVVVHPVYGTYRLTLATGQVF